MTTFNSKLLTAACCLVLFTFGAGDLSADNLAYAGSDTGAFGIMDLNNGSFTLLGNSGLTLAGMAVANGSIFATSYHAANSNLFQVSPANGTLSGVGAVGINVDDFGSTTSGLYAVSFGSVQDLYSIDPSTGTATLIGPTGIGYGSWRGLSTNSSTLYFADGPNLYTLSTSTGAATLVGAFGGSAQMGVLLTEGGILYGGDDTRGSVDTINPLTGLATSGPAPSSSFTGSFYGLAPFPVPSGAITPEPGTWMLVSLGIAGLAIVRRRVS